MKSGNQSSQSVPMYTFKRTTGQQVLTFRVGRHERDVVAHVHVAQHEPQVPGHQSKPEIGNNSVNIDHTRNCIQTSKIKDQKTCSGQFNTQHDPSMYVHSVVGTGRCTMSTTTMHILITEFTYNELAWC